MYYGPYPTELYRQLKSEHLSDKSIKICRWYFVWFATKNLYNLKIVKKTRRGVLL